MCHTGETGGLRGALHGEVGTGCTQVNAAHPIGVEPGEPGSQQRASETLALVFRVYINRVGKTRGFTLCC